MNCEEALAIVEAALHENHLSKLQRTVFRHAWEEQSYVEIARCSGYELGYVKQTGSQLWQLLSQAFAEKVTKHNVQLVLKRKAALVPAAEMLNAPSIDRQTAPALYLNAVNAAAAPHHGSVLLHPEAIETTKETDKRIDISQDNPDSQDSQHSKTDWGDAVDVSLFYGRVVELSMLTQWIERDACRLVGVFGMGGIGKTSLSIKLAKQMQTQFDYVIWRSLRNAPPLSDLLADLIQFLSDQQEIHLPDSVDGRLQRLLSYLRRHRCLIVLDNGETVMRQGDHGGGYLPGYEGYGQLWERVGESNHQSTIVLTSREKPGSIAAHEGKSLPVRSLRLMGLPANVGQEIFHIKGDFTGSDEEWRTLISHYAGNPLALKMVAPVIQDLFGGQVKDFLNCFQEGVSIFGDIQDLLAQQIDRLSSLERQVMNWLAIVRKPVSLSQLRSNFTPMVPLGQLLEALGSLERRCLIDKTTPTLVEKAQTRFTLQPAIMEYITEQLIHQIYREIEGLAIGSLDSLQTSLFHTHALIQAQTKDYIRETQIRLILKPVADRWLSLYTQSEIEHHLRQVLINLRQLRSQSGYAGGNLINLLCQLGVDLEGWDFSRLAVWNAYLRGIQLRQVNFTGADLSRSAFTETFSQVLSVAFSPDGKWLATGDVNHEVHVWQVSDGKQLLNFRIDEGWVWSVAFSPDGRLLASSANRSVHLWNVQTGEWVRSFQGYSDRVFSVAFSPDGHYLATGSEDHLVRVWNVRTGELLWTLAGHSSEVRTVAFSPTGLRSASPAVGVQATRWLLASGSYDGTVRLWDLSTGKSIRVLKESSPWVWSIAFSPDGQQLASGGSDRTIKLWDVKTGRCLRSLVGHNQQVRAIAFSPDGRTLASGSDDRAARIWDCQTGDCLRVLSGHSSWISAVAFSPENHLLASGSEDQSVKLWDSRTSLCLKTLQGYSDGVWSVAFHTEGTLLASGSQDRLIRLWNSRTGKLLGNLCGHTSWVWSVVFCPTQPLLASGSEDCTIRLWNIHTHQLVQTLEGHQDAVLSVLFSPDGRSLFSGSLDGSIRRWDWQQGRCQKTLMGHTGGVWCLALSLDGQVLASSSQDQTIKLWETATGRCFATLCGHESWIRSVAISPDRQTLVSGSADGVIKIWHLGDRTCKHTIQAHRGPVLSVAFHPNGTTIASSGTDATIKLWDAASGAQTHTLEGHQRWVRFLSYSPDGKTLASCSQDETIRLWSLSSLTPSQTLRIPRPYEGMAIAHVTGLTPAQTSTLKMLGAIDIDSGAQIP